MCSAYRRAIKQVRRFQDDLESVARQVSAVRADETQDLLQCGVDLYQWIVRAERRLRADFRADKIDDPADTITAIVDLYTQWLVAASRIESRMTQESCALAGNIAEVREVCLAVREKLNGIAWAGKSRELRNKPNA